MRQIFTSIDIGSNSVKIVVGELFKNKLNLLASVQTPSIGIKKGLIMDGEAAFRSIQKALEEIEEMVGFKIKKAFVNIPSYMAEFMVSKGEILIENEFHRVTLKDMENVRKDAIKNKAVSEKEYVTDLVVDYQVDDKTKIINPRGYVGETLKIRTVVVTVPKKNIYSVVKILELLHIEIVDISINEINCMAAFKTKAMAESLTAIVDIGYETSNVAIYNKGIIIKNSILQKGGLNIDKDLAYIYKISLKEAEKIRKKFALAHKRNASMDDFYYCENTLGEELKINQLETSEIVMARIEEILSLAKDEIKNLLEKEMDAILVTGGVSNMRDFEIIVNDIFGKNSMVGNIKMIGIRDNSYAPAIGMMINFINQLKLKEKTYTMVDEEMDHLPSMKKNYHDNGLMLKHVFDSYWGE